MGGQGSGSVGQDGVAARARCAAEYGVDGLGVAGGVTAAQRILLGPGETEAQCVDGRGAYRAVYVGGPHVGGGGGGDLVESVVSAYDEGARAPRDADRLAIADYAQDVLDRLGHPDGTVIVKLHQFMPKPGTASQRLRMSDPDLVHTYTAQIEDRLRALVGDEKFEQHFRVLDLGASHMHLEVICSRGDRRIGLVLGDLYDADIDLHTVTKDQLVEALARRGLSYDRHLRHMDEPVLPWHTLNRVHTSAEEQLATALYERESTLG